MAFYEKKKGTFAILLVLMLVMLAFAGCGDDSDDNGDNATTQEEVVGELKVTLSIDFPDTEGQSDVEDKQIGLPGESSVLDMLFAYANDNNLEVEIDDGDNPYVKAIGGLAENSSSGWVFTVNDETIMESAGSVMLKDGDEVEWEYTSFADMNDD